MTDVVLYSYWRSSSSYRVRIALGHKGIAYRTAADVTLTIAAVCVVTGIVLFATAPKSTSAPAAQVSVGPTGFALSGRF